AMRLRLISSTASSTWSSLPATAYTRFICSKEECMYTRRDFSKIALAGLPLAASWGARLDSTVSGVRLGVQTYSYRELPMNGILDSVIKAMTETGLAECELFAQQVEPPNPA